MPFARRDEKLTKKICQDS